MGDHQRYLAQQQSPRSTIDGQPPYQFGTEGLIWPNLHFWLIVWLRKTDCCASDPQTNRAKRINDYGFVWTLFERGLLRWNESKSGLWGSFFQTQCCTCVPKQTTHRNVHRSGARSALHWIIVHLSNLLNESDFCFEIIRRPCQRAKLFKSGDFDVLCQNVRDASVASEELNWTKTVEMMMLDWISDDENHTGTAVMLSELKSWTLVRWFGIVLIGELNCLLN